MAQNTKAIRTAQSGNILAQQTISIQQMPLPSPNDLAQFEQINPGTAQQFMDIAKSEQKHRHLMDEKMLRKTIYSQRWAFASVVLVVGLCGFGFYMGFATQACTIGCTVIVSSIVAFLTIRKNS